jgi:hypothetical protein
MTLTFATVSLAGETLLVQFSYEPYKYDLKILLTHWWLPTMLVFCVAVSAFFGFKTPVPAEFAGAGITYIFATVLYQIIRNSFYVAAFTFGRIRDEVSRNGILIAKLSETEIALQTRLGSSGNRRFRLILKRKGEPDIVLTEMPLMEDGFKAHQWYGQTHAENVQTMFDGWVADSGRRDAVDDRDVNIFALAKTLEEFVRQ